LYDVLVYCVVNGELLLTITACWCSESSRA